MKILSSTIVVSNEGRGVEVPYKGRSENATFPSGQDVALALLVAEVIVAVPAVVAPDKLGKEKAVATEGAPTATFFRNSDLLIRPEKPTVVDVNNSKRTTTTNPMLGLSVRTSFPPVRGGGWCISRNDEEWEMGRRIMGNGVTGATNGPLDKKFAERRYSIKTLGV